MAKDIKAFYFVLTFSGFGGKWHRALTIDECLRNLHKPKEYAIYMGVCAEDTPDDVLENLAKCWNVTDMGGLRFYEPHAMGTTVDGVDVMETYKKDKAQADQYFIGWITQEIGLVELKEKRERQKKREEKARAKAKVGA